MEHVGQGYLGARRHAWTTGLLWEADWLLSVLTFINHRFRGQGQEQQTRGT